MRSSNEPPLKKRRSWPVFLIIIGIMVIGGFGGIVLVPALAPGTAAQSADVLRSMIGPKAVAQLESVSFRIQDGINQYRYKMSGDQPQISWNATSQPIAPTPVNTLAVAEPLKSIVPPTAQATSVDISPTLTAPSSSDPSSTLRWQPYGQVVNGKVVLERALVEADPSRSYAGVALIRMDLSQLQLKYDAGHRRSFANK